MMKFYFKKPLTDLSYGSIIKLKRVMTDNFT